METAIKDFENPFLREGDECWSCKEFWEHEQESPRHMVAVRNSQGEVIITRNHGIEIVICPYCDGDVILRLARQQHADTDQTDSTTS